MTERRKKSGEIKSNLEHLKHHYRRNYLWIGISLATFALAYFTSTEPHIFDITPPSVGFVRWLDDWGVIIFENIVATYSLVISLWDINQFWAKPLRTALLTFTWTFFAVALIFLDIALGGISLGLPLNIFMIYVILETARLEG